jgi:hypothetical protein
LNIKTKDLKSIFSISFLMKIAFVHYNIGDNDGVNTVMRTNALSFLERHKKSKIYLVGSILRPLIKGYKSRVKHIDIPEMGILGHTEKDFFSNQDIFDYMKQGMSIFSKLDKVLKKVDYVVIENPNLGIHPAVTYAYYRLCKRNYQRKIKRKIVYRIHDFAEDRRGNFINLLKFRGTESSPYWHKVIFPKTGNMSFVVINKKDLQRLNSHGIIEENRAFYLPNPINEKLLYDDTEVSNKLRDTLIKRYNLENDVEFIYYPVRIVRRKNIEEAIFLTELLRKKYNKNFWLVISLRVHGIITDQYYDTIKNFVDKNNMPVLLGINDLVTMQRSYTKKGNIKTYGVGDMYNISDKIITTSYLEGFGMFFIESWFFKKSIIGRDLPDVTTDFKSSGLKLEHLYGSLFVDKTTDFKDYGNLSERLRLSIRIRNDEFYESFLKENKQALSGLFNMFEEPKDEKKLISENNLVVKKIFSTKAVTKQMLDIFRKTSSELILKN